MKELKGTDERTVVHCETEELANKVLNIAHEAGYKWSSGDSIKLPDNRYNPYKGETCYLISEGIKYCSKTYAEREDYKIIAAEEFIKLNSLKRGEVYLELVDSATCKEIARILESSGESVYDESLEWLKDGNITDWNFIHYSDNYPYWVRIRSLESNNKTKITIEELKQLVGFKEQTMKNQYIKCLSPEHGKRIIAYFESKGFENEFILNGRQVGSYYGIIDRIKPIVCERTLPKDGIEIFLPEESYTITRKALSEVYPLIYGCSKWRKIVEAILNTNLFAEEFPISKERVLEAYSEANPKQLEWLNKYLPKPKVKRLVEVDRWLLADKSGNIDNYSFMSKSLAEDRAKNNHTFIYPVKLTGTFEIEE